MQPIGNPDASPARGFIGGCRNCHNLTGLFLVENLRRHVALFAGSDNVHRITGITDGNVSRYVEDRQNTDLLPFQVARNLPTSRFCQCATYGARYVAWSNHDICTEDAELGGEAALGIELEIQQSGGDRGASAQREKEDQKAAAVRSKHAAHD